MIIDASPSPKFQNSFVNSPRFQDEFDKHSMDGIEEKIYFSNATQFAKRIGQSKNKTFSSDFTVHDACKRNILHQSALRQDYETLKNIIIDYKKILEEEYQIQLNLREQIKNEKKQVQIPQNDDDDMKSDVESQKEFEINENDKILESPNAILEKYINKPDKFNCTPIQICCFQNDPKYPNNREECLTLLLDYGADINSYNPNNLWAPIHWCAFYGDKKSVELLLNNKAISFLCDNTGLYPFDLAGKNMKNNTNVQKLLIKRLLDFLIDCQKFWRTELNKTGEEFIFFQEQCEQYEAQLQNPLLYTKLLYWCCYNDFNEYIQDILENLPRIYIMFPIKSLEGMSCLHACCSKNNFEALKMIVKFEILSISKNEKTRQNTEDVEDDKKIKIKKNHYFKILKEYSSTIPKPDNHGINLILSKKAAPFKDKYYHELERYQTIEQQYLKGISQLNFESVEKFLYGGVSTEQEYQDFKKQFCLNVLQINIKDNHGNTPLHLASLQGNTKIIKYLLNKYADPEAENNEFFKARQLTKDDATKTYYEQLIVKKKLKKKFSSSAESDAIRIIFRKYQKLSNNEKRIIDYYAIQDNYRQTSSEMMMKKARPSQMNKKKDTMEPHAPMKDVSCLTDSIQISPFSSEIKTVKKPLKSKKTNKKSKFQEQSLQEKIGRGQILPSNEENQNENDQPLVRMDQAKHQTKKQEFFDQLLMFSSQLFVPDIVIQFDKSSNKAFFGKFQIHASTGGGSTTNLKEQEINFQIDLLQKAGFEIYMMFSFMNPDIIYIMLKLSEEKLELLAEENEVQIKLIDSYDLEPFKSSKNKQLDDDDDDDQKNKKALDKKKKKMEAEIKCQFEPFRSSQRQKVAYDYLLNSINLETLIKSGIVKSCFPMHTSGGIQIVKKQWQQLAWKFIPQPISQIKDYLSEGKGRNFTSLTTMRLYFGEKVSFYFAWISYLSCIQLFIAIPGLALQLYIFDHGFDSDLLPYWVLYVTIWSTVQIELWKRKTAEINTRWGCIDEMLQVESPYFEGPIKNKFSGDEEIDYVTGKLTKHQYISRMALYFILYIFIFAIFVFASFCIVYGIDTLRKSVKTSKGIVFLLGGLQAMAIQILNLIFYYFTEWYAEKENHKFELTYETSLIYRNASFRFINSYMPLMFIIVTTNDYTLEDIFYFLIPLTLVKKAYYVIINFLVPFIFLRIKIRFYFSKVKEKYRNQQATQPKPKERDAQYYLDEIEQYLGSDIFEKSESQVGIMQSAFRPVIKIYGEDEIMQNITNNQWKQLLETKVDIDAIELNSFRNEFGGTIEYFMEAVTDYGYFILFSAAFPMGPIIGVVTNMIDIQIKLYTLVYMTKRIKSERNPGIGQWLNVLELLSAVGVFTNFVLLYFKHKTATLRMFTDNTNYVVDQNLELWYFVSCVIALSLIKILVRELIPDRPDWVIEEIDKINHRDLVEQQNKTQQTLDMQKKQINKEVAENKIIETQIKDQSKKFEFDKQVLGHEITKLEREYINLSKYQNCDKFVMTEYDMVAQSVMKMRYIQFENVLIIKRMLQLLNNQTFQLSICQACEKTGSIITCLSCKDNLCISCFQVSQIDEPKIQHAPQLLVRRKDVQEELQFEIIINQADTVATIYEESKKLKYEIPMSEPKKNWKKIQYFDYLEALDQEKIYMEFRKMYLVDIGFEHRSFKVETDKIQPANSFSLLNYPIIRNKDPKRALKIEDLLFLNRLAFGQFRKSKYEVESTEFKERWQRFYDGLIQQKIFFLLEFLDLNDDEIILKKEVENFFILSFVTDLKTKKKVPDMIEILFPDQQTQRLKKDIAKDLLARTDKNPEFKEFVACFLQYGKEN